MNESATLVKRFMRGYIGKKEAKRRRIKIGAAIMIQSLVRGFLTRRREMRKKENLARDALSKKANSSMMVKEESGRLYKSRAHASTKSSKQAANSATNPK